MGDGLRGFAWRCADEGAPENCGWMARWGWQGPTFVRLGKLAACDVCSQQAGWFVPVRLEGDELGWSAGSVLLLCYRCFRSDGGMDPDRIAAARQQRATLGHGRDRHDQSAEGGSRCPRERQAE